MGPRTAPEARPATIAAIIQGIGTVAVHEIGSAIDKVAPPLSQDFLSTDARKLRCTSDGQV